MRLICCCCCKNRHIHQANTIIIYFSNDSGKRQRPTQLRALTISYTNSHRHNNGLAAATKSSSFVKPYEICYACNTVRFIERLWPYLYTYSKCRRVQKQRAKLTNLCVWRGVAPVFYRWKKNSRGATMRGVSQRILKFDTIKKRNRLAIHNTHIYRDMQKNYFINFIGETKQINE